MQLSATTPQVLASAPTSASMSPSSFTSTSPRTSTLGLTALHVAVINNNRDQVRALLSGKEHAVDERTATGATALMLASLYGRFDMFVYLLKKTASMCKQDYEGFDCEGYVKHLVFTKPLLQRYKVIAAEKPRRSGQKAIYDFLRSIGVIKQRRIGGEKVEDLPAPSEQSKRRIVSLRKGGVFEVVEVRRLVLAEWGFDLGRKTCAAIRGQGETAYRAIAISGWRGDEAKQAFNVAACLDNATYLKLTRDFAKTVGYELSHNWLDCRFPGSPSERAGAFSACHAEKQLAVYILRESMAHVLGTKDITLEGMAKLKLAVEGKLRGLQPDFTIELEHKPCHCCIAFLGLIQQRTGLHFAWVQREWFSEGKRSKLRFKDGLQASPNDSNTFEDEVDEGDSDWQLVPELDITTPARPVDDPGDDDWVMVKTPRSQARHQNREHELPTKAGSAVPEGDWPIPARENVAKRTSLPAENRKQKRKQKPGAASLGLPSSAFSSQLTKWRHTPIDFEIPIRTVRNAVAPEPEPFPGAFLAYGSREVE